MQFGATFHAGGKNDAANRIKGAGSLPHSLQEPAIAAVNALGGEPSNIQVAIAGETNGDRVTKIRIDVRAA
jgi:hypothetical protein